MILPDVNVLIALAWPNHVFHDQARRRMESEQPSCVTRHVARLTSDRRHVFLGDHPAPADCPTLWNSVHGYKPITDAWLVDLARRAGGTLVTFDAGLRALAPDGAGLEILRPPGTRH